jgi:hypothetical protein
VPAHLAAPGAALRRAIHLLEGPASAGRQQRQRARHPQPGGVPQ